jgi:hypothetical protein
MFYKFSAGTYGVGLQATTQKVEAERKSRNRRLKRDQEVQNDLEHLRSARVCPCGGLEFQGVGCKLGEICQQCR